MLRTLRDVIVEPRRRQDRADQVAIISQTPGVMDETLTLAIMYNGDSTSVTVRVMDSHPMLHEGSLRHRLSLTVIDLAEPRGRSASVPPPTPAGLPSVVLASQDDLLGVIERETPVRVLNISGSGCLLESSRPLEFGSTGEVRLVSDRQTYRDDLRITRCDPVTAAGSVCLAGAEFLWARHPDTQTLRRVIRRLQRDLTPEDARENTI